MGKDLEKSAIGDKLALIEMSAANRDKARYINPFEYKYIGRDRYVTSVEVMIEHAVQIISII